MAWIWTGMAVVSVVCGAVYGRMEAVYDEDLLLRGLWKRCTANCPSADKP